MSKNLEFYRPRINIDVSEELKNRFSRLLPWGTRNALLVKALEQICEAVELGGEIVIYLIINGRLRLFEGGSDDETLRPS